MVHLERVFTSGFGLMEGCLGRVLGVCRCKFPTTETLLISRASKNGPAFCECQPSCSGQQRRSPQPFQSSVQPGQRRWLPHPLSLKSNVQPGQRRWLPHPLSLKSNVQPGQRRWRSRKGRGSRGGCIGPEAVRVREQHSEGRRAAVLHSAFGQGLRAVASRSMVNQPCCRCTHPPGTNGYQEKPGETRRRGGRGGSAHPPPVAPASAVPSVPPPITPT